MQENGVKRRPIILGEFPATDGNQPVTERTQDNADTYVLEQLLKRELAELSRQYPKVDLKVLDKAMYRGAVAFATYVHSQVKITPPGEIAEKTPVFPSAQNFTQIPGGEHLPPVQNREVHDRPDNESALRGLSPRLPGMSQESDVIIAVNGRPDFQGFS